MAESGADGHATELPAEELPQGGVFVRPRKTKIPVSELLTGIMGFLSNPLCGERGYGVAICYCLIISNLHEQFAGEVTPR